MKLAALGVVVAAIGIALSIPGLIAVAGIWIVLGPITRAHGRRFKEAEEQRKRRIAAGDQSESTAETVPGNFLVGTLLLLAIGLPTLAIGIFEIGIDEADRDWRWIPIVVGGVIGGIGVVSSLLYGLGSGLEATADAIGVPEHPATITIRSARETGTYINERPRLEFELTVEPEGLPAYEVTKKATVPHTALGMIRPGDGFHAKVLPEKPESMEIHWDQPILGARGEESTAERLSELEELMRKGLITADEYEAQRRRIIEAI